MGDEFKKNREGDWEEVKRQGCKTIFITLLKAVLKNVL
jgi:hypothetical protein